MLPKTVIFVLNVFTDVILIQELPYGLKGDASVAKRQKNKNKYKEMYPCK